MSPITHFLASWAVAEACTTDERERLWICLAGVAPDVDGLGIAVDLTNEMLARQPTQLYQTYHHFLFHGLFGALVTVAIARAFGVRRLWALLLVFLSFHLHLICDFVGARSPERCDVWVIRYLGPFTYKWTFWWSHQWPLNGWQNFLITIALLVWTFARAIRNGASPVSLFSQKCDSILVGTLRQWRVQIRANRKRNTEPVT
jgi:hypothetical protein